MKINSYYLLLLFTFWLLSPKLTAQKITKTASLITPTIIWRITGKDCPGPSYLLGTMHLADADWLLVNPTMKQVLDSTGFILTEQYSTDTVTTPSVTTSNRLKALPLLTKRQYQLLDSFFVARVGEGLVGNAEAAQMSVGQLGSAILVTLVAQTKGANGVTEAMDMDFFTLYKQRGRKGDRLDRLPTTEFDSTRIDQAKQYLARSLGYIKGSDRADWNIYQNPSAQQHIAGYKRMQFDYQLGRYPKQEKASTYFDALPLEVRNRNWMSKITTTIAHQPTLIAVGLAHLFYRIGLITLLRERGYQVEPVLLSGS